MTDRTCRVCGQTKPEHDFPLFGYGNNRRQPCKACWSKREVKRQQRKRAEGVARPRPSRPAGFRHARLEAVGWKRHCVRRGAVGHGQTQGQHGGHMKRMVQAECDYVLVGICGNCGGRVAASSSIDGNLWWGATAPEEP